MSTEPDGYLIAKPDFPDYELLMREFRAVGRTLRKPRAAEERPGARGSRTLLLGKPSPAVAKGAIGTFYIHEGDPGLETATTKTKNAIARSAAIGTDQLAYLWKVNNYWEAAPVEPDGTVKLGKTDGAVLKGALGSIEEYSDSTTATGTFFDGLNLFADLEDDKWVVAVLIGGAWILTAGECEPPA